jgi:magnesium-transporting ATPase (P-type)
MSDGVCYKAHTLSVEQNLELLGSNESIGLSVQQVASNILRYGANTIPVQKLSTTWEKVWAQVNSVLIYILVTGSVISFSFQHTVDGSVIIGVVVINVSLGYFMAENATEVLKGMLSPSSLVLREGNKQIIEATGLSVGDIFFLQAGDIVPADGRVLHAADLSVLESPLTGESHPIIKNSEAVTLVDAPLAERKCIVYSGTQVLKGTASCVVIAVGKNCEIGKISGLLTEIEVEKTPLLVQLEKFGLILSVIIVCLALAAFGIAHSSGYTVGDALALSIGIAVAAACLHASRSHSPSGCISWLPDMRL